MTKGFLFFILLFFSIAGKAQNSCLKANTRMMLKSLTIRAESGDVTQAVKNFRSHLKCNESSIDYQEISQQLNSLMALGQKSANSTSERKKQCSPVDFRNELPPIRDQTDIGWCYAFTAADLASQKLKQNISPIDIAFAYNNTGFDSSEPEFLDSLFGKTKTEKNFKQSEKVGGVTAASLNERLKTGLCTKKDVFSGIESDREITSLLKSIEDMENQILSLKPTGNLNTAGIFSATQARQKRLKQKATAIVCSKKEDLKILFPGADLKGIIDVTLKANKNELLDQLNDYSCKNRIQPNFKAQEEWHEDANKLESRIHELFNKGQIVGIAYDHKVLFDQHHDFEKIKHGSSVVGRRWNSKSNSCEFLLRNSWGSKCQNNKGNKLYSYTYECEPSGYAWIPATTITKATRRIAFIEDEN